MRNSGCDVPDYMLSLKKPSRDDRKKLAAKAPKRDGISQISKYEKEENRKREEMIAASKKRKLFSQSLDETISKDQSESQPLYSNLPLPLSSQPLYSNLPPQVPPPCYVTPPGRKPPPYSSP